MLHCSFTYSLPLTEYLWGGAGERERVGQSVGPFA